MKRTILALLLAFPCCLTAQQEGAVTSHENARKNFIRQVAVAMDLKENSIEAHPYREDEEYYLALKTGDLRAFRAEDPKSGKNIVRGFAGFTAEGVPLIAFTGHEGVIGLPGGLSDLMKAAEVLDPKKRMKGDDLAKRLLWCLDPEKEGTSETIFDARQVEKLGWEPPAGVTTARYLPQKSGTMILFFSTSQGNTGTLNYHKYSITVMPDHQTIIHREDL